MTRRRLGDEQGRRASWTYTIETRGDMALKAHITLGMYPNGKVGEIFVNVAKTGSPLQTAFEAWAITTSVALQHGTPLTGIIRAVRNLKDGTCKKVILADGTVADCSSLWDAIAQTLERHAG